MAFEFRTYDPRLGRFLSIDPLAATAPYQSGYLFAANNPVLNIDYLGLVEKPKKKGFWKRLGRIFRRPRKRLKGEDFGVDNDAHSAIAHAPNGHRTRDGVMTVTPKLVDKIQKYKSIRRKQLALRDESPFKFRKKKLIEDKKMNGWDIAKTANKTMGTANALFKRTMFAREYIGQFYLHQHGKFEAIYKGQYKYWKIGFRGNQFANPALVNMYKAITASKAVTGSKILNGTRILGKITLYGGIILTTKSALFDEKYGTHFIEDGAIDRGVMWTTDVGFALLALKFPVGTAVSFGYFFQGRYYISD